MRRGINIRKKKRITLNEKNKKCLKFLAILIAIVIVCLAIYFYFIQNIFIKKNFEKDNSNFSSLNKNIPFSLNKIILFHSATAEPGTINQLLSLDISNYCDIGIYLNNIDTTNASIKSLFINNITISNPELGTPHLYKKSISDFGKCTYTEENIITEDFNFNIIEDNSNINYDNYEISSDGCAPISLGFYNKNVKEEFISDSNEILYNGTLLKDAMITEYSLNCTISFTINIITNTDEHYLCNINLDLPFENNNGSIYDTGYAIKEYTNAETSKFIRIK